MVNKIYYKRIQKNKIMTVKELASKKTLTKAEKAFLTEEAARLNISFQVRPNCENCFQDLALEIYKAENTTESVTMENAKYKLIKGFDSIIVGTGERINEATITDQMAKRLYDAGMTKIFEFYEDNI